MSKNLPPKEIQVPHEREPEVGMGPYPDPVPVVRAAPDTLELAPAPPAKVTAPVKLPESNPVKVDGVALSQLTREQLMEHIKKQFRQPESHKAEPAPRPGLTKRQQEQLELETRRGRDMVAHHESEAARFKMPPRTEVNSGITKAPVVEANVQPVGRTDEQKNYVPDQFRKEGHNQARPLPKPGGSISGV